ncbi:cytochrome p450 [Moniliophthora roreri]|nr:cytochrome p450 [Moniliophthora roreri]
MLNFPYLYFALLVANTIVDAIFRRKLYPPGPRKLPFIGNLFTMPAERQWVKFSKWAKQYGPIVHATVGSQHIVILNTPEVINDLFVQKSRILSDRLESYAIRKLFHVAMNANTTKKYRDIQELESRVLLHDLITPLEPEDDAKGNRHWYSFIDRLLHKQNTSVVLTVTYGKRVPNSDKSGIVQAIHDTAENVARSSMPGVFLADHLPILRTLPDALAPWRLEVQRNSELELYGDFLEELRSDIKNCINRPECLVGDILKEQVEHGFEMGIPGKGLTENGELRDMLLTYTAGTLLEAGSDTTGAVMKTFILFMATHPHVLKKAQTEMDQIVGSERMPSFEDQDKLPLLDVLSQGSCKMSTSCTYWFHFLTVRPRDVVYKGWLDGGLVRYNDVPDQSRDLYAFGFGRRYCPGSHIAEASLFITLARLVWF